MYLWSEKRIEIRVCSVYESKGLSVNIRYITSSKFTRIIGAIMKKEFAFTVNRNAIVPGLEIAPYMRVDIYPHENKTSFVAVVDTLPQMFFFLSSANNVTPGGFTVSRTEDEPLGRLKVYILWSKEYSKFPHSQTLPTPQTFFENQTAK